MRENVPSLGNVLIRADGLFVISSDSLRALLYAEMMTTG